MGGVPGPGSPHQHQTLWHSPGNVEVARMRQAPVSPSPVLPSPPSLETSRHGASSQADAFTKLLKVAYKRTFFLEVMAICHHRTWASPTGPVSIHGVAISDWLGHFRQTAAADHSATLGIKLQQSHGGCSVLADTARDYQS